ncbi:hypothetical protein QYF36_004538 [Acer negundo]|nr:hypothetical protein QYF36_004538 [Acer negundo]
MRCTRSGIRAILLAMVMSRQRKGSARDGVLMTIFSKEEVYKKERDGVDILDGDSGKGCTMLIGGHRSNECPQRKQVGMVDGELCSVTNEDEHNDDDLDEVEVIQGDDGEHVISKQF